MNLSSCDDFAFIVNPTNLSDLTNLTSDSRETSSKCTQIYTDLCRVQLKKLKVVNCL